MEGIRVYVNLEDEGATVSDLRVGIQRKKPIKCKSRGGYSHLSYRPVGLSILN